MRQVWKFVEKCKSSEKDTLLYLAYQENKTHELPWYKFVKSISHEAGMSDIENDINDKVGVILLKSNYLDFWKSKLFDDIRLRKNGNKLRSYREIKHIYEAEPYLELNNFKIRQSMAKFRISNHRLRIETGRYDNTPLEQRLCLACHTIEDEQHLLLHCTKYEKERDELFFTLTYYSQKL